MVVCGAENEGKNGDFPRTQSSFTKRDSSCCGRPLFWPFNGVVSVRRSLPFPGATTCPLFKAKYAIDVELTLKYRLNIIATLK